MRDVLLIIPGFSSTALALTEAVKGFTSRIYVTKLWERNDHDTSQQIAPLQLGVRYHRDKGKNRIYDFSTEHQHFMRRGCRHLNTAFEGIKMKRKTWNRHGYFSYTTRTLSAFLKFYRNEKEWILPDHLISRLLRDTGHFGDWI